MLEQVLDHFCFEGRLLLYHVIMMTWNRLPGIMGEWILTKIITQFIAITILHSLSKTSIGKLTQCSPKKDFAQLLFRWKSIATNKRHAALKSHCYIIFASKYICSKNWWWVAQRIKVINSRSERSSLCGQPGLATQSWTQSLTSGERSCSAIATSWLQDNQTPGKKFLDFNRKTK